ncbi:hypothetical protein HMPREF1557_00696 [Streptococcus sobrinus W1703]|uniref:Uncharacterized protein n=1 Tax=Streptococcus sobrinus W1703 TaxID=1227275 RepID=U2KS57_9STRE|nr:hypothetical protein HMPREF1557_00696 [Streptococcus sobrinus W1703]
MKLLMEQVAKILLQHSQQQLASQKAPVLGNQQQAMLPRIALNPKQRQLTLAPPRLLVPNPPQFSQQQLVRLKVLKLVVL